MLPPDGVEKENNAGKIGQRYLEMKNDALREALSPPIHYEHRLELVRTIEGVQWINDSKATNCNAVWLALSEMPARKCVHWIMGGEDKGNNYTPLLELVRQRVTMIHDISIDRQKARVTFGALVPMNAGSYLGMEHVVRAVAAMVERDDVVLLSPACVSFDRFQNYEDRGRQFKAAVCAL